MSQLKPCHLRTVAISYSTRNQSMVTNDCVIYSCLLAYDRFPVITPNIKEPGPGLPGVNDGHTVLARLGAGAAKAPGEGARHHPAAGAT